MTITINTQMIVSNHTQRDGIRRCVADIGICERQLRQFPVGEYAERMRCEIETSRLRISQLRAAIVYIDHHYP